MGVTIGLAPDKKPALSTIFRRVAAMRKGPTLSRLYGRALKMQTEKDHMEPAGSHDCERWA